MIKLENTEVYGWEAAIRGMRNPLNSWSKSDSKFLRDPDSGCWGSCPCENIGDCECCFIGEADLALVKKLVKAGSDHSKFMRMINVTVDITAPMYWVAEHDTYKVSTVRNSCSFMHKGVSEPFKLDDFSIDESEFVNVDETWDSMILALNTLREEYLKTKDDGVFYQLRQLLPQGYNVRYTWQANYQVLRNIYHSRKNHRLKEWRDFCGWIETLPYSELITE